MAKVPEIKRGPARGWLCFGLKRAGLEERDDISRANAMCIVPVNLGLLRPLSGSNVYLIDGIEFGFRAAGDCWYF